MVPKTRGPTMTAAFGTVAISRGGATSPRRSVQSECRGGGARRHHTRGDCEEAAMPMADAMGMALWSVSWLAAGLGSL